MRLKSMTSLAAIAAAVLGLAPASIHLFARGASAPVPPFPDAAIDEPLAATGGRETIVVAGGCFWGVQAVFQHTKGVLSATSGYAGGSLTNPSYERVSSGTTGHAESVRVVYDPSQISLGRLLKVFFSVAHDPTELNRQGPDEGPQYRSMILFGSEPQAKIVQAYIDQLNAAHLFHGRIVTEVVPLNAFYPAEAYHQDYASHHPFEPYIMINDRPKVEALRKRYPELYVDARAPTS
jgi:peptide-methionine (S)-S-oxide reductase